MKSTRTLLATLSTACLTAPFVLAVNTVDTTPPDTLFLDGPPATVSATEVTIEFDSTELNSTFEATLDGNPLGTVESPLQLTNLAPGPHFFSVAAKDPAGNVDPTPLQISWQNQAQFLAIPFFMTGQSVPVNTGIQDGAVWTGFGTPAVGPGGVVAFVGKWKAPAQKTPVPLAAQNGTGIFVFENLIVKVGDDVPGIPDVVFASFRDPVVDGNSHVAFIAKLKSKIPGVILSPDLDTVVVASRTAPNVLQVLAREGDPAPDTLGAVFKGFSSVSIKGLGGSIIFGSEPRSLPPFMGEPGVAFTASLRVGFGDTLTTGNDTGAWWMPGETGELHKLVREGDGGFFAPGDTVKTFSLLKPVSGSPGVGRGFVDPFHAFVFASSANRQQAVFSIDPGAAGIIAQLGGSLHSTLLGEEVVWGKLSLPSTDNQRQYVSLLGALKTNIGGVTGTRAKGIFQSQDSGGHWEPIARTGDPADIGPDTVFNAFKDPVNSLDDESLAFVATVKGSGIVSSNNDGLFYYRNDFTSPVLIAREGTPAPSAPGSIWKSFSSISLPGGHTGPLFTASLVKGLGTTEGPGGITSANDFGLYFTDYDTGAVVELVREGQPFVGKTVKNFSILKAAPGSAGNTRAFNDIREVVLLVNFTDHTTAMVGIILPGTELPPL